MAKVLSQALLMAAKDTRIFLRDRFALAFSFLFPLVFVAGFSLALGDVGGQDDELVLVVSTQEEQIEGSSSWMLIDEITAGERSSVQYVEHDEAMRRVESGEIDGFVLFPEDFTARLFGDPPASVEVVIGDASAGRQAALRALAGSIASGIGRAVEVMSVVAEVGGPPALASMDPSRLAGSAGLVELVPEQIGSIEPRSASNVTLPGYLTMFVFFAAAMSAEAIVRERRNHTLERLMSNGARRESVVIGKFLSALYRGVLQVLVLWVAGIFVFNIDLGVSPAAVVLISLLMVLASSAFGVMLASLVQTENAASGLGVLVSLALAPLGGCWWPLFITPQWMQSLAKLTPHGWANTAFNKLMLFGAEFGDVLTEMGMLALFAAAFLAVTLWRFRLSID